MRSMPVAGRVDASSSHRRVFFVADASLHLINSARARGSRISLTNGIRRNADRRTCGRRLALAERRKIKNFICRDAKRLRRRLGVAPHSFIHFLSPAAEAAAVGAWRRGPRTISPVERSRGSKSTSEQRAWPGSPDDARRAACGRRPDTDASV